MVNLARKIKNLTGDYTDIEVIRYFTNNDTEYLIYSLNEIDESGYTKLYASKIIGTKACIITDNDEWTLVKEIIKEIGIPKMEYPCLVIEDELRSEVDNLIRCDLDKALRIKDKLEKYAAIDNLKESLISK